MRPLYLLHRAVSWENGLHLRSMIGEKIEIIFFTKPNCPLCEEAKEVLEEMKDIDLLSVREVDITEDMTVYEKYKHRIPVIEIAHKFVLSGRIERRELEARIRQAQKERS